MRFFDINAIVLLMAALALCIGGYYFYEVHKDTFEAELNGEV